MLNNSSAINGNESVNKSRAFVVTLETDKGE